MTFYLLKIKIKVRKILDLNFFKNFKDFFITLDLRSNSITNVVLIKMRKKMKKSNFWGVIVKGKENFIFYTGFSKVPENDLNEKTIQIYIFNTNNDLYRLN